MITLFAVLVGVIVLLVAIWLSFLLGSWDTSDDVLWARYGKGSRTIRIDHVDIRIKDEGDGPVVVLLHGAFGNLNFWDTWADKLVANGYRVIRFDGPPEGLSGLDGQGHSHARLANLTSLLLDELGVRRAAIGGTSRGGQAAFQFAAKNPGRVTHLLLMQTPVYNYKLEPFPLDVKFWGLISRTVLAGYRPMPYWQAYLGNLFENKASLTSQIVKEYTDFSNRSGHREILAAIQAPGSSRDRDQNRKWAASITAPTLVLATPNDAALDLEHQKILKSWFPAETSELVVMPTGGHFPPLEDGAASGDVILDFMNRHSEPSARQPG